MWRVLLGELRSSHSAAQCSLQAAQMHSTVRPFAQWNIILEQLQQSKIRMYITQCLGRFTHCASAWLRSRMRTEASSRHHTCHRKRRQGASSLSQCGLDGVLSQLQLKLVSLAKCKLTSLLNCRPARDWSLPDTRPWLISAIQCKLILTLWVSDDPRGGSWKVGWVKQ